MKKIKSFTYLDNYKMYSISSQIFEGLTDYILSSKSEHSQERDIQEGLKGSGHILADIITKSSRQVEKKFLHDYAYTLFEDALTKQGKVLEIDIANVDDKIQEIDSYDFIKIKGRIIFNDAKVIENTIRNFNDIGYHIGFLSRYQPLKEEIDRLVEQTNAIKNRNQKAKQKSLIDSRLNFKKLLQLDGLQQNEELLKSLAYTLNHGYKGNFEVQMPFTKENGHSLFSCLLNREFLKEEEGILMQKYSRNTEKEFVIFGIATQTQKITEKLSAYGHKPSEEEEEEEDNNMKKSLMNIAATMADLEKTFSGKLSYEYMIDPIAIYREL